MLSPSLFLVASLALAILSSSILPLAIRPLASGTGAASAGDEGLDAAVLGVDDVDGAVLSHDHAAGPVELAFAAPRRAEAGDEVAAGGKDLDRDSLAQAPRCSPARCYGNSIQTACALTKAPVLVEGQRIVTWNCCASTVVMSTGKHSLVFAVKPPLTTVVPLGQVAMAKLVAPGLTPAGGP
jgi:hypothetical protein